MIVSKNQSPRTELKRSLYETPSPQLRIPSASNDYDFVGKITTCPVKEGCVHLLYRMGG